MPPLQFSKPNYDRLAIWHETEAAFRDDPAPPTPSKVLKGLPPSLPRPYPATNVRFFEADCVDVAVQYAQQGYAPLLHNMCSWTTAGGGVTFGAPAQEEELFRRSNYYKHLTQDLYPLEKYDTILNNGVLFFRRGLREGYVSMDAPVQIDCVAAPAAYNPQIDRSTGGYADPADVELMVNKVRMLMHAAVENGNDVLVCSAWGCGAYGCPPLETGRIFRKVLEEVNGCLKEVAFAILGGNFAPFREGFMLGAGASR